MIIIPGVKVSTPTLSSASGVESCCPVQTAVDHPEGEMGDLDELMWSNKDAADSSSSVLGSVATGPRVRVGGAWNE